jgi:hypothetical protein
LAPAWELVRVLPVEVPRDWPSRWIIAGGRMSEGGRMIALKGDPVWGELGSYQNFQDALGVDHPPFAFNSGMGWQEVPAREVRRLGITGPDGETPEEWLASEPRTLTGKQALPIPVLSTRDMDPEIVRTLEESGAVVRGDQATIPAGTAELDRRAAERDARRQERMERAVREARESYERGGTP